jgi:hypothetical protein
MHWGKYWRSKNHKPKSLCSGFPLCEIDSFDIFNSQLFVQFLKHAKSRIILEIPKYHLKASLLPNNHLHVIFDGGSYTIPVEQKPCNFGGFYNFFHCPKCDKRMRKLYCLDGQYLCRKCANLGYYSQRLRPSQRNAHMSYNVKDFLQDKAGSLNQRPPWMKQYIFQKLRRKYIKYDQKYFNEVCKELMEWYGERGDWYFPPSDMWDAFVER